VCRNAKNASVFISTDKSEPFIGGVGDKTRFIPLHAIAVKVGKPVCEVLPATHALTGCDITSKFDTKAAGINAEPVLYLKDFGRAHTDVQNCVQSDVPGTSADQRKPWH